MEIIVMSAILFVIALVTATGVLDFIFVNYGPGYENGKFKWFKKTKYKKRPSRIMFVTLSLVSAALLLAVEYLNFSAVAATIVILALVAAVAVLSFRFVERD